MSKFFKTVKTFPRTFWVANIMELFERWAWYGLFGVLALYITNSVDEGALGFSQAQKGTIMGVVTSILYFLPIITGVLADRFGYKKMLILAYLILGSGYYLMGVFTGYVAFFLTFLYVAVGAGIFKPIISATITKTTNEKNSSIGFGIFYMLVNVGGFLGPAFSSKLRNIYGWKIIFIMLISAITVNLLLVLFFYKEPERQPSKQSVKDALKESVLNIWEALKDFKLVFFLIIMVGFWTLFNQLFYTLPNYIYQWLDTSILYNNIAVVSPGLARIWGTAQGDIAPEMIILLDSLFIILFQLIISTVVMKFKPINTIVAGLLILTFGVSLSFWLNNPLYTVLGVLIFSIGEMTSSPKFTEYIGRIAPKNKEALYMGTSFLPVAAGNGLAGILSGKVYQNMSDKVSLLRLEMESRGHSLPQISDTYTQNDFIAESAKILNTDTAGITKMLWENYNPSKIWYIFAAIGFTTVIALILYNKFILRDSNNDKVSSKNS